MTDTPDPKPKSHGRLTIRASTQPRDLMAEERPVRGAFEARVITLFPEAFPGTLGLSLTGKALDMGLWRLLPIALRPFGEGRHRNVDDTPAGGGAGMVLRADVVDRALSAAMGGRRVTAVAGRSSICRRAGRPSIRPWRGGLRGVTASPCSVAGSKASISGCWTRAGSKRSALAILS